MLGNKPLPVDNLYLDMELKFLFKRLPDDPERVAPVVIEEIFDVLQEECFWLLLFDYSGNIEEQRALGRTFKPVRPAESIFLAHACNRKRLTWESGQEHIVIRDLLLIEFCDVADQRMTTVEVFDVSLISVCVPFARKHAATTGLLKAEPHAADAGKQ